MGKGTSTSHNSAADESFDILIIGAGISGINTAYHIQKNFPKLRYCILEGRSRIGGTWDLFKYPGVRSDTDLPTLGFAWNHWTGQKLLAGGADIADYIRSSAEKEGIDKYIRFDHQVSSASWSSSCDMWDLEVSTLGNSQDDRNTYPITTNMSTRFLILGSGYYDYKEPLRNSIPGLCENFKGQIIHPQFWPENLDYKNKRVVVVGSGSTAVALLPSMARAAKLVTMLQRSPSYIMSLPNKLGKSWYHYVLPKKMAALIDRIFYALFINLNYYLSRLFPRKMRAVIQSAAEKQLPQHIPVEPHFQPSYQPWDQRLCFSPDGDFYEAMRNGSANVATGRVKTATSNSIILESGESIEADMVVTATGINLKIGGRIDFFVDGKPIDIADRVAWRAAMLQDVPNLGFMIGYVNASITMGVEASALLLCRIIRYMQNKGFTAVVPRFPESCRLEQKSLFQRLESATYVQQCRSQVPRCVDRGPWRGRSIYAIDRLRAVYGSIKLDMEYKSV